MPVLRNQHILSWMRRRVGGTHTPPQVCFPRLGGAQRNGRSNSGTLSSCHKLQLERLTLDIRKKKKIARSIVQCQNRVPVGRWSLCSWEFSCLGYTKPQVTRSSMAIVLLCVGDWRRPLWCSLLNKNISEAF